MQLRTMVLLVVSALAMAACAQETPAPPAAETSTEMAISLNQLFEAERQNKVPTLDELFEAEARIIDMAKAGKAAAKNVTGPSLVDKNSIQAEAE